MSLAPRSSWTWPVGVAIVVSGMAIAGCGTPSTPVDTAQTPRAQPAPAVDEDTPPPPPAYESGLPEGLRSLLSKPFTGDFDGMVARRMVRVGVTFNCTFFFVDQGVQRGVDYEFGKAFEDELMDQLNKGLFTFAS
jgi:hypothetical protein